MGNCIYHLPGNDQLQCGFGIVRFIEWAIPKEVKLNDDCVTKVTKFREMELDQIIFNKTQ